MIKNIIREVAPEACDFSFYFDDDGLTERGGDYCYNLFIISNGGLGRINGEEADSCYGYIVADSEAWRDEDYKRIVCEWAGINEDETRLELIDGQNTYTTYSYRVA